MATIMKEALSVLNDLELKIDEISRNLPGEERDAFSNRIAQAQSQLEEVLRGASFSEYYLSEAANKLIDSINASLATSELLRPGQQISSNEDRAARLAQLEKSESITRAPRPTHPEKSTVEQYTFLANQIINKCQIVRQAINSSRPTDAKSRQAPNPR